MKKLLLLLSLFTLTNLIASELSWVDEQIQAIKPSRSGMTQHEVALIRTPFIFIRKKNEEKKAVVSQMPSTSKTQSKTVIKTKKYKAMRLTLIVNNAVMISGNWYHIGESVGGYKIAKVDATSVLLKSQTKELLLSTRSSNKKLKFQK